MRLVQQQRRLAGNGGPFCFSTTEGAAAVNLRQTFQQARQLLAGGQKPSEPASAERKTLALPTILAPYQIPSRAMPKPTPDNLRRFAETPVVRRAINIIKDRVASLDWQIRLKRDYTEEQVGYVRRKQRALRYALEHPNPSDSFRTLLEQVLEDALVGGYGAIEMETTDDPERPFHLWPVDGASIQIDPKWDGNPSSIRYAQNTGMPSSGSLVKLRDDELIYLRTNPRSYTPFGLGPLEVAFESVNSFLGAHRYAGKLASNAVVQYALWVNDSTPAQQERLIRWWQDEIEGTGRVPLLSTPEKPEVLRFAAGTDADMRMNWQEFLIRMIANAFSLPPVLLGLEQDVNRATAAELMDEAFHSAIVPMARLVAEHITRDLFAKRLGWPEFEFVFNQLDATDEMQQMEVQTALLAAGVLTVNEVRAMRGLAPLRAEETGTGAKHSSAGVHAASGSAETEEVPPLAKND
ncbi:MAG TPA: phage portal protein [Acidobacterium sp.]|uniref:Putative bacteriophage portal protein n=2 Tax=Acidobacteriaceae TaxID=204434 RepID=C1F165_ACIC5|nr:putative bacteriophage portal protein [Acidobacterium capsulatum ATCC 51196]HCT62400.1 phage portal protein [Acidobacterium sp.]